MPRGGRRPGAGAPKGNFNSIRSGNGSRRMAMVYVRLLAEPDKLAVGRMLYEAGFIKPPPHEFPRRDVPRLTEFLWRHWFDSSEDELSKTIKDNQ